MQTPYLEKRGNKKVLMVEGKPFYMISGEVHNSNSSSVQYMERVWDKAEQLGMNSLLLPVTWEMLEPREGEFDFSVVNGLVLQARKRGKKIGFLWFGAWKNAQCSYAPVWVKKDLNRFRRTEIEKGKKFCCLKEFHGLSYTSLSYLCKETNQADARAFGELMRHIRCIDEDYHTVIIMQVENETGIMGAGRENSDEADKLFDGEVPIDFASYMMDHVGTMAKDVKISVGSGKSSGSWKDVFGDAAEEIFSAYYIASYVHQVAKAGKEEYPLPMFVNCWLDKGEKAGMYPSGGPVSRMMEVWKYCAPSIDIISPDIYVPNFCDICDEYMKMDNPLFIPETATHSYAAPRLVYTIGHYHAVCYSPFGFEEMGEPFGVATAYLFGVDITDPLLQTPQNTDEYAWYTSTLCKMMSLITDKYGTEDLKAVICEKKESSIEFGEFGFKLYMDTPLIERKDGVALAVKESEDTFYIIVNGAMLVPYSTDDKKPFVDILCMEDGEFDEGGNWVMNRRLNGDEITMMAFKTPALLKVKLFVYS